MYRIGVARVVKTWADDGQGGEERHYELEWDTPIAVYSEKADAFNALVKAAHLTLSNLEPDFYKKKGVDDRQIRNDLFVCDIATIDWADTSYEFYLEDVYEDDSLPVDPTSIEETEGIRSILGRH